MGLCTNSGRRPLWRLFLHEDGHMNLILLAKLSKNMCFFLRTGQGQGWGAILEFLVDISSSTMKGI